MSDTNFTPGPWVVENGGDIFGPLGGDSGDGIDCDGNDGWQVAEVGHYSASVDGELMELGDGPRLANIALIKAAPELFEALEIMLADYWEASKEWDKENQEYATTVIDQSRAALAKARGKPQ